MTTIKGLNGRVALVTGAGAGIGRAIAQELAQRGASVTVTGWNAASIDAAAEEITASGA